MTQKEWTAEKFEPAEEWYEELDEPSRLCYIADHVSPNGNETRSSTKLRLILNQICANAFVTRILAKS